MRKAASFSHIYTKAPNQNQNSDIEKSKIDKIIFQTSIESGVGLFNSQM